MGYNGFMDTSFTKRTLIVVGVLLAGILLLLAVWQLYTVLFLLLAAVLIAVLLSGLGELVSTYTPIGRNWAVAGVLLTILLVAGLAGLWVVPALNQQSEALMDSFMQALQDVENLIRQQSWGDRLLESGAMSLSNLLSRQGGIFSRLSGIVSNSFVFLTDIVIVTVVGLYFAFTPQPYINGLIKLTPAGRKDEVRLLLARIGRTLQLWLVGRFSSMVIVGIFSYIGLLLLGVPLAAVLALLTGLLAFVPIIGPAVAVVAPVMVAFTQSPQLALWVFLLYIGIQGVESYFLTPMIQREAVEIPPVLLLLAQVILGLLTGALGILLAPPLMVVLIITVKMFYIEDILGDHDLHYAAQKSPLPVEPSSQASSGSTDNANASDTAAEEPAAKSTGD